MSYKAIVKEIYPLSVCVKLTYIKPNKIKVKYHVKDKPDGKVISEERPTAASAWEYAYSRYRGIHP